MYHNEFERKQAELSQDEARENFTIEQVFDENEVQLIEELKTFIEQFEMSKVVLQQQLIELQGGDPNAQEEQQNEEDQDEDQEMDQINENNDQNIQN